MKALRSSINPILVLLAALFMLLSACQPASLTPNPSSTQDSHEVAPGITLDFSLVSNIAAAEIVAAHPGTAGVPYWEAAPKYQQLTLQSYPVANHLRKPQIFIYSVGEMVSANENMGKVATDLQALL